MDDLEKCYGKETFVLYALFASVPGKKVWPRRIFLALSVSLQVWGTLSQVLKIVTANFKRQFIIELMPTIAATLGCLLYIPYVVLATEKDFKTLLSIMISDLKEPRTEEENEVKRLYYKNAKLFVNGYTMLTVVALSGMSLSGFIPYVLDLLIPLNQTRERILLFGGEFLMDEQKYYYHIYFLECCCVVDIAIVIVITENIGVIVGQHACGMTAVLGHRIENLTRAAEELDEADYTRLMRSRFRRCVKEHQKLVRFTFLIVAFYDLPLTLVLSTTFCALTVSLVQVTDMQLINPTIALFTVVQIFQLYILSYMGQCGIDYAEKLAVDIYNSDWWAFPLKQRKSVKLMMMRASKPCLIVARNMYTLSMQNFLAVMQTVTSFYMVLRQTQ